MRPSLDEFALTLADAAATRSEDPKHQVGAVVLAHDGRVLGVGYNGSPPGVDLSDGEWSNREIVRATVVHAETNAMVGVRPHEARLLATTLGPCARCIGMAERLGIRRIISRQDVPSSFVADSNLALRKFGTDFEVIRRTQVTVGDLIDANDFDMYQVETRRTGGDVPANFDKWQHMILGFLLGLGGEAGEVLDLHKKDIYHGVDTTPKEIELELGDALFYLTRIADMHGIPLSAVAASNTAKLLERYPDGFVKGGGNR